MKLMAGRRSWHLWVFREAQGLGSAVLLSMIGLDGMRQENSGAK
jgi:hypothetical protein